MQGEYLRNVELARVLDKRRAKKAAEVGDADPVGDKPAEKGGVKAEEGKEKMKARYRQREAVDRASGLEQKGMDSVLGSVFG